MRAGHKGIRILMLVIVFSLVFCFSNTALAAPEFPTYKIIYHCNYTPAAPDVEDFSYYMDFTIKNVGKGSGECDFRHPLIFNIFQGWSLTPGGEVAYAPGDSYAFTGRYDQTLDLYAVWKRLQLEFPYSVKYYANYPPNVIHILLPPHEESYFSGATVVARSASTYVGSDGTVTATDGKVYNFSGWGLTAGGWVKYYPGDSFIMPAENVDLYGVWTTKPILNRDDHNAYMQGYPDGTFGPTRNMTRAEAVVMFSRLLTKQMDLTTNYTSTYSDVVAGKWYANAIGYMQEKGVLSTTGPRFRPDDQITRAEFADLACGFENLTSGSPSSFSDVAKSHPYYKEINYAVARGWLAGYPDGTFRPDNYIYRSEVIAIVNRVLERYADEAYIDSHASSIKKYSDLTKTYWAYYLIMEASNSHDYTKVGTTETWTGLK